jgi:hypothetical protein
MSDIADQAHDMLLDETVFGLYKSACSAWAEFGEWDLRLTPSGRRGDHRRDP